MNGTLDWAQLGPSLKPVRNHHHHAYVPFIMNGPLSQSSPGLKEGKLTPVSESTIFASKFDISLPTAPATLLSFKPTVPNTLPVDSVNPYDFFP